EHNQAVLGTSATFETLPNVLAQEHAAAAPAKIGAQAEGLKGRSICSYHLRLRWIASLFIRLGSICDMALLDVLGESSEAKPREPRILESGNPSLRFWGRATEPGVCGGADLGSPHPPATAKSATTISTLITSIAPGRPDRSPK